MLRLVHQGDQRMDGAIMLVTVVIVLVCAQAPSHGLAGGSCRTRTYNQTVMSGRL